MSKTTEAGTVGVQVEPALEVLPTVGRIVHMFKQDTTVPLAAIISEVGQYEDPHKVTLAVFERRGTRTMHEVEFSVDPAPGKWSWPSRG